MRNKIWYALVDAKLGVEYLSLYSLRIRKRRNYYKTSIIIIAGAGAALTKFWEASSIYACMLIFIGEWFTKLERQLIMSDVDFIKFSDLKIKYAQLFYKLDRLMTDFDDDCLTNEEIKDIYSETSDQKIEIAKIDEELNIPRSKSLYNEAEKITDLFLKNHY